MTSSSSSGSGKSNKGNSLRKEAASFTEKLEKRGVVYLARVPPFMKPNKARDLLSQYGEVTRLFLQEEDPAVRVRRRKLGGNVSKQFVEGWVEYAEKKVARSVAESLNNTKIGSKKGDFYHDDMWNLKYLKGFKWDYLTEKFAYERRVREQKINASMMLSKKKNSEFADLVDKNKAYNAIEERKRKKRREIGEDSDKLGITAMQNTDFSNSKKRKFRQTKSIGIHHSGVSKKLEDSLLNSLVAGK